MKEIATFTESTEKLSVALSNLIPQLFFDVIARLIPGFVIIWSFYYALLNAQIINAEFIKKFAPILPDNQLFLFLISSLIFYVISIIFYGLWSFIVFIACLILSKSFTCNEDIVHRFLEVLKAPPEFTLRHDYIKLYAPGAGNRITKLKAEIHMSGALTVAFSLCFIICGISYIKEGLWISSSLYLCLLYFFGALGLFFSNRHFSIRLCRAVNSYSELLRFKLDAYSLPKDMKC